MITFEETATPPETVGRAAANEIRERRLAGETLQQIADAYGITRERVRQIVYEAYGSSFPEVREQHLQEVREKMLAEYRESILREIRRDPFALSRTTVVERAPVPVQTIEDVLGDDSWVLPVDRSRSARVPWDQALESVKRVWTEHVAPEPLTRVAYDKHRSKDDLSGARLIQIAAWSDVCADAGVPSGKASRKAYTRLSPEDAVAWVTAYLSESVATGGDGDSRGFERWTKAQGGPSLGAVRATATPPSWNAVRGQAVVRLLEWYDKGGRGRLYPPPASPGIPRTSQAEVEKWRGEVARGVTIADIAKRTGIPKATIRYHVSK